jgi:hypothetical protein
LYKTMGFIMKFSYMYVIYFDQIHLPIILKRSHFFSKEI